MDKVQLLKQLINLNIPPRYYSIGPEIKESAHNIELLASGKYALYYLERGEKVGMKIFDTEDDAMTALISRLKQDIADGLNLD